MGGRFIGRMPQGWVGQRNDTVMALYVIVDCSDSIVFGLVSFLHDSHNPQGSQARVSKGTTATERKIHGGAYYMPVKSVMYCES